MRQVLGQCYEIRHRLKQIGCEWDGPANAWFAPDDVHAEAQSLADVENLREWREFLGTLAWCDGSFTATVWDAGLRAASLFVPYAAAVAEIASRVRATKRVSDRWFERNVGRAYALVKPEGAVEKWSGGEMEKASPKPVFQNKVLKHVAERLDHEMHAGWLADRSPMVPFGVTPGDFLEALYESDERVVVFDSFRSQGQWVWSEENGFACSDAPAKMLYDKKSAPASNGVGREFKASGADGVWYLCNPVTGDWEWMDEVASNDEPHWSRRFWKCVTSWRYMVLESDRANARAWCAMAVQLPLRIAAIYTSGGKSVHVLVRVDARSKEEWDKWRDELKPLLIPLGADQGAMSAVRLTRLPDCRRGDKMQKLLYLNPAADMTPIASMPVRRDAVGPWVRWGESLAGEHPEERDWDAVSKVVAALEFYSSVPGCAKIRDVLKEGKS